MIVHHRGRPGLRLALAGLLLAGLALTPSPASAAATPALPWDLNGDGYAELVLGAPGEDNGSVLRSGAVTVLRGTRTGPSTTGARTISQSSPGVIGVNETGDAFGAGLASCDFNADGYADLVIGAQGERIAGADQPGRHPVGTVSVLYGSAQGPRSTGNQLFDPSLLDLSDSWGAVLECGDLDDDGYADLVIGGGFCCYVSDEIFEEHPEGITVVYGSATGLDASTALHLTAGDAVGHPDLEPFQGGFGAAIAVGDIDGDGIDDLVVATSQDVETAENSYGGIEVFAGRPQGIAPRASTVIPLYPDLNDRFPRHTDQAWLDEAEIGDFDHDGFGDLALGVGVVWTAGCETIPDCPGSVLVLPGTADGPDLDQGKVWHAGSPGVAGRSNNADRFGDALAAGDLNGDGRDDLAIGSPGKSVGVRETGGVTVLYGTTGTGLTAVGSQVWVQSSPGVPGADETGDRFGTDLVISRLKGSAAAGLVIGIPFEDTGSIRDAGAATVLFGSRNGVVATGARTWSQNSAGVPGTAEAGDWFGLPGSDLAWPTFVRR